MSPSPPRRPFDSLPTETLTVVFRLSQGQKEYDDSDGATRRLLPIQMMRVCHRFHAILVGNPSFWTDVAVDSVTQSLDIEVQLKRAGNLLLNIWLTPDGVGNREAQQQLQIHTLRWASLMVANRPVPQPGEYLTDTIIYAGDVEAWINGPLPNLHQMHIGGLSFNAMNGSNADLALPGLRGASFGWNVPRFHLPESPALTGLAFTGCYSPLSNFIRYLAEAALSLKRLTVRDSTITNNTGPNNGWAAASPIIMPNLENFSIRSCEGYVNLLHDLLNHIQSPNLLVFAYDARGDRNSPWPSPVIHLDLGRLVEMDLHAHILAPEALANLLTAASVLQVLMMPSLSGGIDMVEAAGEVVRAHCSVCLKELHVRGVSMSWLRRVLEVLPAVKTLNLTGDGGGLPRGGLNMTTERAALTWVTERVPDIIGLVWQVRRVPFTGHVIEGSTLTPPN